VTAPNPPDALAATKFTAPRVPSGWVPRRRLVDMVENGLDAQRDAVPPARGMRFDLGVAAVGLLRARLRGDLGKAIVLVPFGAAVPVRMAVRLHRARLLAAAGRPGPALEMLEGASELADGWPVLPALRGLMSGLRALTEAALGQSEAPAAALAADGATAEDGAALARLRLLDGASASLDEAEPHGLRRPFLELGASAGALLRRQLRRGTSHRSLVVELLRDLGRPEADPRPRTLNVEPLSEREAAVLRFLPTMMSNGEISAQLFVSVNTVKTHLKSIYRKLDVADRREAVRRARELELLAP
jgi:LuxR family maltose regulon positive regulatory protein